MQWVPSSNGSCDSENNSIFFSLHFVAFSPKFWQNSQVWHLFRLFPTSVGLFRLRRVLHLGPDYSLGQTLVKGCEHIAYFWSQCVLKLQKSCFFVKNMYKWIRISEEERIQTPSDMVMFTPDINFPPFPRVFSPFSPNAGLWHPWQGRLQRGRYFAFSGAHSVLTFGGGVNSSLRDAWTAFPGRGVNMPMMQSLEGQVLCANANRILLVSNEPTSPLQGFNSVTQIFVGHKWQRPAGKSCSRWKMKVRTRMCFDHWVDFLRQRAPCLLGQPALFSQPSAPGGRGGWSGSKVGPAIVTSKLAQFGEHHREKRMKLQEGNF